MKKQLPRDPAYSKRQSGSLHRAGIGLCVCGTTWTNSVPAPSSLCHVGNSKRRVFRHRCLHQLGDTVSLLEQPEGTTTWAITEQVISNGVCRWYAADIFVKPWDNQLFVQETGVASISRAMGNFFF